MRSSLVFTAALSALIVAAAAVHADPVKTTPKPLTPPPVTMKPKAMTASSSSSSSADKGKGSDASKTKVPDYQKAIDGLVAAKQYGAPNSKDTQAEGVAKQKALTDITNAIAKVKEAAAGDKVTITETTMTYHPENAVSKNFSTDGDNAALLQAESALGRASGALRDGGSDATTPPATQEIFREINTDIADATKELKSVTIIRPDYQIVMDNLQKADTELNNVKEGTGLSIEKVKDVRQAKTDALTGLKDLEKMVDTITKTEHVDVKLSANGGYAGSDNHPGGSADDRAAFSGVKVEPTFEEVGKILETVHNELLKGDNTKEIEPDFRKLTDELEKVRMEVASGAEIEDPNKPKKK